MADTFSRAKRSEVMSRIRGMDTQPELAVRRTLHRLGHRFRLHIMSLPGRPDIALPRHRMIIQVKGCFWHAHFCLGGRIPPGKYWRAKLARNRERDRRNERRLRGLGWRVITVWECRVRRWTPYALEERLQQLLAAGRSRSASARRSIALPPPPTKVTHRHPPRAPSRPRAPGAAEAGREARPRSERSNEDRRGLQLAVASAHRPSVAGPRRSHHRRPGAG